MDFDVHKFTQKGQLTLGLNEFPGRNGRAMAINCSQTQQNIYTSIYVLKARLKCTLSVKRAEFSCDQNHF